MACDNLKPTIRPRRERRLCAMPTTRLSIRFCTDLASDAQRYQNCAQYGTTLVALAEVIGNILSQPSRRYLLVCRLANHLSFSFLPYHYTVNHDIALNFSLTDGLLVHSHENQTIQVYNYQTILKSVNNRYSKLITGQNYTTELQNTCTEHTRSIVTETKINNAKQANSGALAISS